MNSDESKDKMLKTISDFMGELFGASDNETFRDPVRVGKFLSFVFEKDQEIYNKVHTKVMETFFVELTRKSDVVSNVVKSVYHLLKSAAVPETIKLDLYEDIRKDFVKFLESHLEDKDLQHCLIYFKDLDSRIYKRLVYDINPVITSYISKQIDALPFDKLIHSFEKRRFFIKELLEKEKIVKTTKSIENKTSATSFTSPIPELISELKDVCYAVRFNDILYQLSEFDRVIQGFSMQFAYPFMMSLKSYGHQTLYGIFNMISRISGYTIWFAKALLIAFEDTISQRFKKEILGNMSIADEAYLANILFVLFQSSPELLDMAIKLHRNIFHEILSKVSCRQLFYLAVVAYHRSSKNLKLLLEEFPEAFIKDDCLDLRRNAHALRYYFEILYNASEGEILKQHFKVIKGALETLLKERKVSSDTIKLLFEIAPFVDSNETSRLIEENISSISAYISTATEREIEENILYPIIVVHKDLIVDNIKKKLLRLCIDRLTFLAKIDGDLPKGIGKIIVHSFRRFSGAFAREMADLLVPIVLEHAKKNPIKSFVSFVRPILDFDWSFAVNLYEKYIRNKNLITRDALLSADYETVFNLLQLYNEIDPSMMYELRELLMDEKTVIALLKRFSALEDIKLVELLETRTPFLNVIKEKISSELSAYRLEEATNLLINLSQNKSAIELPGILESAIQETIKLFEKENFSNPCKLIESLLDVLQESSYYSRNSISKYLYDNFSNDIILLGLQSYLDDTARKMMTQKTLKFVDFVKCLKRTNPAYLSHILKKNLDLLISYASSLQKDIKATLFSSLVPALKHDPEVLVRAFSSLQDAALEELLANFSIAQLLEIFSSVLAMSRDETLHKSIVDYLIKSKEQLIKEWNTIISDEHTRVSTKVFSFLDSLAEEIVFHKCNELLDLYCELTKAILLSDTNLLMNEFFKLIDHSLLCIYWLRGEEEAYDTFRQLVTRVIEKRKNEFTDEKLLSLLAENDLLSRYYAVLHTLSPSVAASVKEICTKKGISLYVGLANNPMTEILDYYSEILPKLKEYFSVSLERSAVSSVITAISFTLNRELLDELSLLFKKRQDEST